MTSQQYEELCRYFVSAELKLPLEAVRSVHLPNPRLERESWHATSGKYLHQVDLYWELWDWLTRYVHIANAKWHSRGQVGLCDVLLLQQVRTQVGAHKAFLMTNSGFSRPARRAADDAGIGLLIVRPQFAPAALAVKERRHVQTRFQELARAEGGLYSWQVVQKGVESGVSPAELLGIKPLQPDAVDRMPMGSSSASALPPTTFGAPGNSAGGAGGHGGYPTRQGPGTGFRTK